MRRAAATSCTTASFLRLTPERGSRRVSSCTATYAVQRRTWGDAFRVRIKLRRTAVALAEAVRVAFGEAANLALLRRRNAASPRLSRLQGDPPMEVIGDHRVIELEARVAELEARLGGVIRVVAASRPLGRVLAGYGVSADQERVVYAIVNEMAERHEQGQVASFAEFEERITHIIGQHHGDRQFVELIVDALRIEQPAFKRLYTKFTNAMALFQH